MVDFVHTVPVVERQLDFVRTVAVVEGMMQRVVEEQTAVEAVVIAVE